MRRCVDLALEPPSIHQHTHASLTVYRSVTCAGHVLHVLVLPPSPPPPSPLEEDATPPPLPPYYLFEEKVVTGAFTSTGLFFLCFCTFCAWCGLNGRVRGTGLNKWPGVKDMRIDRPQTGGPDDRGYFPTQLSAVPRSDFFLSSLPVATRGVKLDPARQSLLMDA